jgi:GNAT superfamily N-acetyltransferase
MSSSADIAELARRLEANEIAAWRSMYHASPPAIAARLGCGYTQQDGALLVWNRAAPVLMFNRIMGLGVFEPATDALIDGLLARARAEKSRGEVQVVPTAQPADLVARLTARGLKPAAPWQVHYRAIDGPLPSDDAPSGYRIERVTPANAAAWGDALLAAWDFPPVAAAGSLILMLPIAEDPDFTCFAAVHEESEEVVGGGALFVASGVGGLYGDGVRAEHRRHHLHEALIATRLAEARRRGCDLAASQTPEANAAQHNLALTGFEAAYTRLNYLMPKYGSDLPDKVTG